MTIPKRRAFLPLIFIWLCIKKTGIVFLTLFFNLNIIYIFLYTYHLVCFLQVEERNGAEIIYKPMIYYCTTDKPFVWLLLVYGYKGILLLFGLFLAWETRKVKIATLNDSHYVGK